MIPPSTARFQVFSDTRGVRRTDEGTDDWLAEPFRPIDAMLQDGAASQFGDTGEMWGASRFRYHRSALALPEDVGCMPGVDGWCALADEVIALSDSALTQSATSATARLGVSADESRELGERIYARQDPAGQMLFSVIAFARRVRDVPVAQGRPASPPYTPAQMDAALALAAALQSGPAEGLAARLAAADRQTLAALPPDAAGELVLEMVRAALDQPTEHTRVAVLGAVTSVADALARGRFHVADVVSLVASAPRSDDELEAVAGVLALALRARVVAGVAEALHDHAAAPVVVDLLRRTAELVASRAGVTPVGPMDPSLVAPPSPAPRPVRPSPWWTTWRGGHLGRKPAEAVRPAGPTRQAYPRIDVDSHRRGRPDVVVLGESFDVVVGLGRRRDSTLLSTGVMQLPTGVETTLELVLVFDPSSLTPRGPTRLTVVASDADPYPSATVGFDPLDREDERLPAERRIGVHYLRDGHLVGIAWRSFVVVGDRQDVATAPVPETRESELLDLTPLLGEDLPDLILSVCAGDGPSTGQFVWTALPAASGVTVPDLPRTASLGTDLQGFVATLRRNVMFSKGVGADYSKLAGAARQIGDAVPAYIRSVIHEVVDDPTRATAPTILLLTEETALPWELASFREPLTTDWGGKSAFLGAHAAIGRWPLTEHQPRPTPRTRVTVHSAAVLTADYTGIQGWGRLEHAMQEAAEIGALFAPPAVIVRPALWDVIDVLRGTPPADVLHVALHGSFDAQGDQEGLVLLGTDAEGQLTKQWQFFTPAEVENGTLEAGPFVFLNACQVGSGKEVLGDYGGFASTLLRIGASAVVAPLWNVDDAIAAQIARDFYAATWTPPDTDDATDATEPVSAAEAVRAVRARYTEDGARKQADGISATLVAFQVFGHPRLRLVRP